MHTINATLINLYHVCPREMWLHARGIRMEHTSDVVYEGKLIGENSYEERSVKNRELALSIFDGAVTAKMDFYDPVTRTVHETKKSDKAEKAHIAQVKFYLWVLEQSGVNHPQGIIEYPRLRTRETIVLEAEDRLLIPQWIAAIRDILEQEDCPPVIRKSVCRSCSYGDYCYIDELSG